MVAHPPPRVSIAGRNGDGSVERLEKRCRTTGKSVPRSSAPRLGINPPLPPRREWKWAENGPALSPHPPPGKTAMEGFGDLKNRSKPPRRVSLVVLNVVCDGIHESRRVVVGSGRGQTRHPGRSSPVETAMNARRHPSHGSKRGRRVSSVVLEVL